MFGRKRIIMDRDDKHPYMIRWQLIKDKTSTLGESRDLKFNIYLHKIMLSDEPVLHDHPWDYFTFILWGGYWEHTPEGKFWRGPGHWRFSKAKSLHWIEVPEGSYALSLFMRTKKTRTWGFNTSKGWVDYKKYLTERATNGS
tara:strand:- start:36798 stop:37223 length:426 start_codon:yes stop_codon:yes gene_type:complete